MGQTLKQYVSARGARYSEAGRDLLEKLCRMEAAHDPIASLPAHEAAEALADSPTFKEWLRDSNIKSYQIEPDDECSCGGSGKCNFCLEMKIDRDELKYDEIKEQGL